MKIEEPETIREIHEIRRKMYEATKNLTPDELIACHKQLAASLNRKAA